MNVIYMKIKNHKIIKEAPTANDGNKKSDKIKKDRPKTSDLEKAKKYKDENPYDKMFV